MDDGRIRRGSRRETDPAIRPGRRHDGDGATLGESPEVEQDDSSAVPNVARKPDPTVDLAGEGGYARVIAGELNGANGQGKSREECLANLREAIALILKHRREETLRALPPEAGQQVIDVG